MGPKKGKGKGGPVDGVDTTSMSREQLEAFSLRLREELDREREERNFFQLERDKLRTFWEITRQQLEENRAQLRNQDRAQDENEEKHQSEIKSYKQKVKHLLYEQKCNLSDLKVERVVALKMAQDEYTAMENELLKDKCNLKAKLREQELAHQEVVRQLKMEQSAEVSKLREQFAQDALELERKYEARLTTQNEELGLQHAMELGEVEQRKNGQVVELTKSHEKAFNDMKNYYNEITLNNLALISSLKEQMEELKSGHERMEKHLREVQGENKRLTEPLKQARTELANLHRQLSSYEQDKITLVNTKQRLALVTKELEDLRWENEVLELRFEKVEKERNRLHAEFVGAVLDVQQKTGLKSAMLEKKMSELRGGVVSASGTPETQPRSRSAPPPRPHGFNPRRRPPSWRPRPYTRPHGPRRGLGCAQPWSTDEDVPACSSSQPMTELWAARRTPTPTSASRTRPMARPQSQQQHQRPRGDGVDADPWVQRWVAGLRPGSGGGGAGGGAAADSFSDMSSCSCSDAPRSRMAALVRHDAHPCAEADTRCNACVASQARRCPHRAASVPTRTAADPHRCTRRCKRCRTTSHDNGWVRSPGVSPRVSPRASPKVSPKPSPQVSPRSSHRGLSPPCDTSSARSPRKGSPFRKATVRHASKHGETVVKVSLCTVASQKRSRQSSPCTRVAEERGSRRTVTVQRRQRPPKPPPSPSSSGRPSQAQRALLASPSSFRPVELKPSTAQISLPLVSVSRMRQTATRFEEPPSGPYGPLAPIQSNAEGEMFIASARSFESMDLTRVPSTVRGLPSVIVTAAVPSGSGAVLAKSDTAPDRQASSQSLPSTVPSRTPSRAPSRILSARPPSIIVGRPLVSMYKLPPLPGSLGSVTDGQVAEAPSVETVFDASPGPPALDAATQWGGSEDGVRLPYKSECLSPVSIAPRPSTGSPQAIALTPPPRVLSFKSECLAPMSIAPDSNLTTALESPQTTPPNTPLPIAPPPRILKSECLAPISIAPDSDLAPALESPQKTSPNTTRPPPRILVFKSECLAPTSIAPASEPSEPLTPHPPPPAPPTLSPQQSHHEQRDERDAEGKGRDGAANFPDQQKLQSVSAQTSSQDVVRLAALTVDKGRDSASQVKYGNIGGASRESVAGAETRERGKCDSSCEVAAPPDFGEETEVSPQAAAEAESGDKVRCDPSCEARLPSDFSKSADRDTGTDEKSLSPRSVIGKGPSSVSIHPAAATCGSSCEVRPPPTLTTASTTRTETPLSEISKGPSSASIPPTAATCNSSCEVRPPPTLTTASTTKTETPRSSSHSKVSSSICLAVGDLDEDDPPRSLASARRDLNSTSGTYDEDAFNGGLTVPLTSLNRLRCRSGSHYTPSRSPSAICLESNLADPDDVPKLPAKAPVTPRPHLRSASPTAKTVSSAKSVSRVKRASSAKSSSSTKSVSSAKSVSSEKIVSSAKDVSRVKRTSSAKSVSSVKSASSASGVKRVKSASSLEHAASLNSVSSHPIASLERLSGRKRNSASTASTGLSRSSAATTTTTISAASEGTDGAPSTCTCTSTSALAVESGNDFSARLATTSSSGAEVGGAKPKKAKMNEALSRASSPQTRRRGPRSKSLDNSRDETARAARSPEPPIKDAAKPPARTQVRTQARTQGTKGKIKDWLRGLTRSGRRLSVQTSTSDLGDDFADSAPFVSSLRPALRPSRKDLFKTDRHASCFSPSRIRPPSRTRVKKSRRHSQHSVRFDVDESDSSAAGSMCHMATCTMRARSLPQLRGGLRRAARGGYTGGEGARSVSEGRVTPATSATDRHLHCYEDPVFLPPLPSRSTSTTSARPSARSCSAPPRISSRTGPRSARGAAKRDPTPRPARRPKSTERRFTGCGRAVRDDDRDVTRDEASTRSSESISSTSTVSEKAVIWTKPGKKGAKQSGALWLMYPSMTQEERELNRGTAPDQRTEADEVDNDQVCAKSSSRSTSVKPSWSRTAGVDDQRPGCSGTQARQPAPSCNSDSSSSGSPVPQVLSPPSASCPSPSSRLLWRTLREVNKDRVTIQEIASDDSLSLEAAASSARSSTGVLTASRLSCLREETDSDVKLESVSVASGPSRVSFVEEDYDDDEPHVSTRPSGHRLREGLSGTSATRRRRSRHSERDDEYARMRRRTPTMALDDDGDLIAPRGRRCFRIRPVRPSSPSPSRHSPLRETPRQKPPATKDADVPTAGNRTLKVRFSEARALDSSDASSPESDNYKDLKSAIEAHFLRLQGPQRDHPSPATTPTPVPTSAPLPKPPSKHKAVHKPTKGLGNLAKSTASLTGLHNRPPAPAPTATRTRAPTEGGEVSVSRLLRPPGREVMVVELFRKRSDKDNVSRSSASS